MGGVIYMVRMHTTGSDDTDKISQCGKPNQSEGILYIILVIISKGLIGRGTFSKRKALLLGMAVLASRFCSIRADTNFIPIRANSNFCNIDYSKLPNRCGSDGTYAIHCVYDSDGQLGICCTQRLWIPKGHCPFFSKAFGVLDYQPCFAEACSNDKDWYMSDEAFMYPGCQSNNFSSVAEEILLTETTTQTRQSVTDSCYSLEIVLQFVTIVLITSVGCIGVVLSVMYCLLKRKCGKACRERSYPKANTKSTAVEVSLYPDELQGLNSSDSWTTTAKENRKNMTL